MNKSHMFPILGCGLALFSSCKDVKTPIQRPNILFIMADDHSRAAISAYKGIYSKLAPTPNIDAIGADGVIMHNMMCTNSISGPSRASLVTGKYSTTHGYYQNEGGISFDNTQEQYQKILRANGYTTSLFGKWHMLSEPKGFDYYMIHGDKSQQGTYYNPLYDINGKKVVEQGYCTTITANAALKWLDTVKDGEKPFCMMLHFKAPHRPWKPDSCYVHLYDDIDFPVPATFDDDYSTREQTLGKSMAKIAYHLSRKDLKMTPPKGLTPKEAEAWLWYGGSGKDQFWTPDPKLKGEALKKWKFERYLKDYLRCVKSVDDQVGRVVAYLKKNNLYDNTIIMYMGDQGFFLGEYGIYDKRWMYEESLQMPCLISYPNAIKKGQDLNEITLNVDVAPTLLDFVGIKPPKDMQGVSMKGILEGNQNDIDHWRKEMYYQYFEYPKWHNVQPHYGVRTERYKLIHFYYNIDTWELYDLKTDSNELHNLYGEKKYDKLVDSLKTQLDKLQRQYNDTISLKSRRAMTDKYMFKYDK